MGGINTDDEHPDRTGRANDLALRLTPKLGGTVIIGMLGLMIGGSILRGDRAVQDLNALYGGGELAGRDLWPDRRAVARSRPHGPLTERCPCSVAMTTSAGLLMLSAAFLRDGDPLIATAAFLATIASLMHAIRAFRRGHGTYGTVGMYRS